MLPTVSGEFRVVKDPELRFSPSGTAVCRMRVVASKRKKNEQTGEWEDDKQAWLNAVVFKQSAEHAAESYQKGDLVLISGQLETEDWEDSEGNKRLAVNVLVNQIGMSTAFNPVQSVKTDRQQGGQQQQRQQQGGGQQQQRGTPADDPWASRGTQSDEPPF